MLQEKSAHKLKQRLTPEALKKSLLRATKFPIGNAAAAPPAPDPSIRPIRHARRAKTIGKAKAGRSRQTIRKCGIRDKKLYYSFRIEVQKFSA